jgi:hypothetical protein
MTPEIRRLLEAAIHENEGTGLGGTTLMRCRICGKGWQHGATFPQARHQTGANCIGEQIDALLALPADRPPPEAQQEDLSRVAPSAVAPAHGDLPRTPQPDGSPRFRA